MPDRLPSVDADELLRRYDALVAVLSDAASDEAARAGTKAQIIALFRDVERALAELGLLRDDVKELVALWKVQPVLEPALAGAGAAPVPERAPAAPPSPLPDAAPDAVPELLDVSAIEAVAAAARAHDAEARRAADAGAPGDGRGAAVEHVVQAGPGARITFESGQSAGAGTSMRFDYLGASTYVAKGWSAISVGAYGDAERALRRALELAPDDREAGALLGWSLMGQERLDEALVPLREVLAHDAEYPLARVSVGYVHYRQGSLDEAVADLTAVVNGGEDRKAVLYAHYWLGLVYQRRGMHADALGYFRQALALGPNLLQAYYEMGRVLWRTNDRAAALDAWRAGAAANKFNAWGKRCEEVRVAVEAGGEPPPLE